MRQLGKTGIAVSALGLGTVKLGRDQGVRYPQPFTIPDERAARQLLAAARHAGINLVDTAPAYGTSEERLGKLLAGERQHWVLCTKVGEEFSDGRSRFDFSPEYTRSSIHRSLRRLGTEVIDIALIHSNGEDLAILEQAGTLETLRALQKEGCIRACGISTKTVAGGIAAASSCDVVMATYNSADQSQGPVLDACADSGTGVLVKKALDSGHLLDGGAPAALATTLEQRGVHSIVIGTVSPRHLAENVAAARHLTG